jgi:predicted  nucleic acid-binding Zn-ribbon protein
MSVASSEDLFGNKSGSDEGIDYDDDDISQALPGLDTLEGFGESSVKYSVTNSSFATAEAHRQRDMEELEGVQREVVVQMELPRHSQHNGHSEVNSLHAKEERFWAALTPADAHKLRGMLQAAELYQQHLQENEHKINDLHGDVERKERTYRTLRRRVQQASQSLCSAEEHHASLEEEYEHWGRRAERHKATDVDLSSLQVRQSNLKEELQRLHEQAGSTREHLIELRLRLDTSLPLREERKARMLELEAAHDRSIVSLRAELDEQRGAVRAAEISRLQAELQDARLRTKCLAKEHSSIMEDLQYQQREGTRLHRQCAEARDEVLDLAAQARLCLEDPRIASQLDVDADGMTFLPLPGDDPDLDVELDEVHRQSRSLERECQRTFDALERKQAECQRWRQRYLDLRHARSAGNLVAPEEEVPEPFVLGPKPGTAESEIITTPRYVL